MSNQEVLNRLNLFEGVVIGIYGNWLISLVDKISFDKVVWFMGIWYQPLCVVFSFCTLLLLFAFSIFRPMLMTRWMGFLLGFGHAMGNLGALLSEGLTPRLFLFYCIGTFLYYIIYLTELRRIRTRQRRHEQAED